MIIRAELTWVDGAFRPGIEVELGGDGRILRVGPASAPTPTHPGTAMLPGFVNAHLSLIHI